MVLEQAERCEVTVQAFASCCMLWVLCAESGPGSISTDLTFLGPYLYFHVRAIPCRLVRRNHHLTSASRCFPLTLHGVYPPRRVWCLLFACYFQH